LERDNAIRGILAIAQTDPRFVRRLADFDKDDFFINTPGGNVNIYDLSIIPNAPDQLNMHATTITPDMDPEAESPRFDRFLLEITNDRHDLAAWIIARLGYGLTGCTNLQDFMAWVGSGSNGKGVLTKLILYIMGSYAKSVDASIFLDKERRGGPAPELLDLRGVRLVFSSETSEGEFFDVARLKSMTGQDEQVARALFSNVIVRFFPKFKIVILTNHIPRLHRVDYAFRRRFKLTPFDVRFSESQVDPELLNKLQEEAPAILGKLIRAAHAYVKTKTIPPCSIVDGATEDYFLSEDPVARWLQENTVSDPAATTAVSDLYKNFTAWQESQGTKTWSAQAFGRALSEKGYGIRKVGIVYREGLRLA
jgi:putative DNA primase/helicase